MDLPTAVKTCFNKYVTFSGRARRAEYWYWVLFTIIGSIILGIIDGVVFGTGGPDGGNGPLGLLFSLGTLLPGISAAVRRMHDINRSGWWVLIGLIPILGWILFIFWAATKGTEGDNRFGPDPLAGQVVGA